MTADNLAGRYAYLRLLVEEHFGRPSDVRCRYCEQDTAYCSCPGRVLRAALADHPPPRA